MIDHVLREVDRTAGSGLDREGDLAKVFGVDSLMDVYACGLQNMVSSTRQGDAALFSRMTEHDATVFRIAGSVMEKRTGKDSRLARIIPVGASDRLISYHLRRDHDRGLRVEERHTIGDGRHVPMHERNQTPGGNQYLFACGSLPEDFPVERPGLHIQPSVVA